MCLMLIRALPSSCILCLVVCSTLTGCTREAAAPDEPKAQQQVEQAESETEAQAAQEVPKPSAMGAWLEGETLRMRYVSAIRSNALEANGLVIDAKPEHYFLRVNMEVEYKGVTKHRLVAKRFWVGDSAGRNVPVSQEYQAAVSSSSDELFLVAGMKGAFEVIFEMHERTEAYWMTYQDAASRMVGYLDVEDLVVKDTAPVKRRPPRKKPAAP